MGWRAGWVRDVNKLRAVGRDVGEPVFFRVVDDHGGLLIGDAGAGRGKAPGGLLT